MSCAHVWRVMRAHPPCHARTLGAAIPYGTTIRRLALRARAARTHPELREGACAPPQHRKNTRNATPKARRRGEAGPVPGCPAVPGHRRQLARLPLGLAPGAVGFRASRRVVVPPSSEPPNPARQELASRSPPAGSRTPPSLTDPLLGETPDLQPPGGKTLQASSPPRTAPRLTPNRCPAAVPPPSDSYMASPARRRRRPHGREQPEQPTGPGRSWPSTLRWLTPGSPSGRERLEIVSWRRVDGARRLRVVV